MDDNKSGTDFQRLEPIKERIRNKEADVLLLKDASRLGRNILESLVFTDFLEKHKVELVFESERYDEDMFPLIAWFNERRAKDDSTKIRRVLRHKMEEGEMVIKSPYGYIKKENLLVVDKESASVVKEIFELFLSGCGKYEIAGIMNRRGYPTPSQIKSSSGKYTNVWNRQHIERILGHLAYTGDMPYGMRRKISFKSKKYENVDKADWIIISNHHEGIITKEDFEAAQQLMVKNKIIKARKPSENIFSGLLFCGRCGSRMYRKKQKNKRPWYLCCKNDREGGIKDSIRPNYGCSSHRIGEAMLVSAVKSYIYSLILSPELKDGIALLANKQEDVEIKLAKDKQATLNRISALKSKASRVYDDKLEGQLAEYLFTSKIEEITNELAQLEARLNELEKKLSETQAKENGSDKLLTLIENIQEIGINNLTLSLLFKKILVFNPTDIKDNLTEQYNMSNDEFYYLQENGGVLFIQNFALNIKNP